MVDQTSQMFITGPDVVKTVTGEDVTLEELGGARTHNTRSGVAHYLAPDEADAIDYVKTLLSYLPANNLDPLPVVEVAPLDVSLDGVTDADRELDTFTPTRPTAPTTCTPSSSTSWTTGSSSRCRSCSPPTSSPATAASRAAGRGRGQPAHPVRRHAGHRRQREGRAVRAHLRRLQHPGADLRRRPRLPARHLPGVGGHHPPRRQADLRLRRGHRAAGHRHHPQGLRRRLRRHGLQAPGRRRQTWPGRPRRSPSSAPRAPSASSTAANWPRPRTPTPAARS